MANPPLTLTNAYQGKSREFYFKCAEMVCKLLESTNVKKNINEMCDKELIKTDVEFDIRIMVFPGQGKPEIKGTNLRGMTDFEAKQMSIYPPFQYKDTIPDWLTIDDSHVQDQITMISIKSLVHEILHKKYNQIFMQEKKIDIDELEAIVIAKSLEYTAKILHAIGII